MRPQLFYNPLLLVERLGQLATEKLRLRKLSRSPAACLQSGHIDSLELLELLRPLSPKVIYDIGANVGTWTLLSKTIFPDAEVHAFEPLTFHVNRFDELTSKLTKVHIHTVALGSAPGVAEMKVVDFSDASSLLPLTVTGRNLWRLKDTKVEAVRVERLDEWCATTKIPKPDFLKLDVQGFELEVLKGATDCLGASVAVLTEVSFQEFYQDQCLFHDIVEYLWRRDFLLVALGHGTAIGRRLVQGDALFLKRSVINVVEGG